MWGIWNLGKLSKYIIFGKINVYLFLYQRKTTVGRFNGGNNFDPHSGLKIVWAPMHSWSENIRGIGIVPNLVNRISSFF